MKFWKHGNQKILRSVKIICTSLFINKVVASLSRGMDCIPSSGMQHEKHMLSLI